MLIEVLMAWTLISGNDPEDGSLPLWFTVTAINAPGQRDDPSVTLIMGGIGVAIFGVALIVLVLRMLLARPSPATPRQRS